MYSCTAPVMTRQIYILSEQCQLMYEGWRWRTINSMQWTKVLEPVRGKLILEFQLFAVQMYGGIEQEFLLKSTYR